MMNGFVPSRERKPRSRPRITTRTSKHRYYKQGKQLPFFLLLVLPYLSKRKADPSDDRTAVAIWDRQSTSHHEIFATVLCRPLHDYSSSHTTEGQLLQNRACRKVLDYCTSISVQVAQLSKEERLLERCILLVTLVYFTICEGKSLLFYYSPHYSHSVGCFNVIS